MDLTLTEIGNALNAKIQGGNPEVTGVAFDSRQVQAGDLFVALVAENDGHAYLQAALDKGAAAVMVDDQHAIPADMPAVIVPNTLQGMQDLGKYWLDKVAPITVAITGSNGKTTTKDMVAAIASQAFKTYKTPENFNNEIGVPLTLLAMPADTEVLVVEMGMDRPGQLTALSELVQPDMAVITMIGEAHIEFFKTREKIAQAKLEITKGLREDGVLIIPDDEPLLTEAQVNQRVLGFGEGVKDIKAEGSQTDFVYDGVSFAIPLLGRYNVMNALAAITVGRLLRVKTSQMVAALAHFDLTKNRTEQLMTPSGVHLISDVYNANPTATKAVLATMADFPAGQRYALLGDMLELGEQGPALHASLATAIADAQLSGLYLVGPLMTDYLAPLIAEELPDLPLHTYQADQLTAIAKDLQADLKAGDWLLLKASHGLHLEEVVKALMSN
ncbi:UDP-N-acetylmuramoyl-tripeptide--D-alanyl-D-alanine ligase [Eupransor demetentiae]|uniref:UDP-N-acetylmuramoyl-tripeptide--D-alanyl-D-alanine ligase n=1 Tax=Eupransor demetentiae TaxID=3109584 RepID=A0ABP0EQR9_9LACO|nr:UDP-N-acetylmuramyl pentapeptide synthase (MurF) [Lactobacillaceae bacterium LMG 33000]